MLQNILQDGLGQDLMNAKRFCFSCEQIFADRRCLEEHMCPSASHICSCGTEFGDYSDMLEHSTTHEPGHQVLDHETIRKRRIEKRIAEEAQLKRLDTGEVVWKAPSLGNVPSVSLPVKTMPQLPFTSALMQQVTMQSGLNLQVPQLYPSTPQASAHQNPVSSTPGMKNIFAGVGAPTVDLWTIYQPVVLMTTVRKFSKNKPYSCSKCGQCFATRTSLVSHHSSHVPDKVSGCIGCGLLLSSKKIVPRFHICNAPNNSTKFKLITAKPPGYKMPNQAGAARGQRQGAQGPGFASFLNLKSQNVSAGNNSSQAIFGNSTLQAKNMNIKPYNQSNQVYPSMQLKRQNPNPPKTLSPNPSAANRIGRGRSATPQGQSKGSKTVASMLTAQTTSKANAFTCRVCHIPFETTQLLQRHKCAKAQEFIAQRGHKMQYKSNKMTGQHPAQMNGGRKVGVPSPGNIQIRKVVAIDLEKEHGAPVNGGTDVDMDDDCYIVEKGPDKPAEMIYQVTSSVPIKT